MSELKVIPQTGCPRILFFSGGTALRATSRELIRYTSESVHVITPFDSGGSSAVIRRAFNMPAVGDIRNRLMALADLSRPGGRAIFALFTYRFSKKEPQSELLDELRRMVEGRHVLVDYLADDLRRVVCAHLEFFLQRMPEDFDLRGASIGNLVLTAGYLDTERNLAPVIDAFSSLARVRGVVRPVVDADLHMAAELEDGSVVVGQHLLTGKEAPPLSSPIKRIWMTDSLDSAEPVVRKVDPEVRIMIERADCICYPVGSFYSSVVANLLPMGVGEAVAANPGPKMFVPNPGGDPELLGHTVLDQVKILRRYLFQSGAPVGSSVLTTVLVDSRAEYPGGLDIAALEELGVTVRDLPLFTEDSQPMFAPTLLAKALLFPAC
ncbi:GAK system CofD-like protein [Pseudodesulfovibrio sp. zrk46]|uniref:GAK system CofD-like protein n=1 Tax=Pseudodesulfovibrio sp. zrk46 TaxID=2725288 RepID=UPI001FFC793D|nr:GAK system CofD-like protein [Pseudodesulfovibrio sp. zrk46]